MPQGLADYLCYIKLRNSGGNDKVLSALAFPAPDFECRSDALCAYGIVRKRQARGPALNSTTILPRKIIKVDEKVLLWHNLKDAEKDNIRFFSGG